MDAIYPINQGQSKLAEPYQSRSDKAYNGKQAFYMNGTSTPPLLLLLTCEVMYSIIYRTQDFRNALPKVTRGGIFWIKFGYSAFAGTAL